MPRKPLIAGNWKMNLNHLEAIALVQKIAFALPDKYFKKVDVTVIPPFTDLRSVQTLVEGDRLRITYGAQDVSVHPAGAFTGEVSAAMLAKLGCSFVVVGHSERRQYHNEVDATVAVKTKRVLEHAMTPIVCIGEGLGVREAGTHVPYCLEQLHGSLKGLTAAEIAKIVIAYEPIWAIGSGRVATPGDAQEVCGVLRRELHQLAGEEVARAVRVLYGGSVNAQNVAELVAQPDIDGALVGGASLKGEEFATLSAIAAGGPLP